MYTVIITDRHTTPMYAAHRRLFAPFLADRGGSICQCSWYEPGADIEQAVPELYESIKGYPVWRAIIVTQSIQTEPPEFDKQNPFDFYANKDSRTPVKENIVPLIRLTHMLAGFPPLGVKRYETGYACENLDLCENDDCAYNNNRCVLQSEFDALSEEEKEELRHKCGRNLKQRLIEIQYSKEEKTEHSRLTKKYVLKENRPAEILILTTREIFEYDEREKTIDEIRSAWEQYDEEESSYFWQRSDYPNICRFICYDLINTEHTEYKSELWKFWLLALTLAVNQVPNQMLQAYKLYKAVLDIDAAALGAVFEKQIGDLLSVKSIIQDKLFSTPRLTREKDIELVPQQDISVRFEHLDESSTEADYSRIGLASDCPVSEKMFWRKHIQSTKLAIENILSAPQEIVAAKAIETRGVIDSFTGREQVLDRFQLDRIRKRISELETQVINSKVYSLLDTDTLKEDVDREDDEIRKHLGNRLTKRNVIIVAVSAILAYFCGYLPYLISSARINWPTFGAAFLLTFIALILLSAGGLSVLWLLRRSLLEKLETYNKTLRVMFDRVNQGARIYSDYFSNVSTYMYARSLQSGVTLKKDNDYSSIKLLNAHLSAIGRDIESMKQLCSLYGVPVNDSSLDVTYVEFDAAESPAESLLYELKPDGEKDFVKLGEVGEKLDAPYSFIVGLRLDRQEIYETKGA